jgi:hypothetical protein
MLAFQVEHPLFRKHQLTELEMLSRIVGFRTWTKHSLLKHTAQVKADRKHR